MLLGRVVQYVVFRQCAGIIVNFDKQHPWFALQRSVPLVTPWLPAGRWQRPSSRRMSTSVSSMSLTPSGVRKLEEVWAKDLSHLSRRPDRKDESYDPSNVLTLLRNEIGKEVQMICGIGFNRINQQVPDRVNAETISALNAYISDLVRHYRKVYSLTEADKEFDRAANEYRR